MEAKSPPTRGRGLKHPPRQRTLPALPSPPTRGRGLKLEGVIEEIVDEGSPPTRGRGLKQYHGVSAACFPRRPPRGGAD